VSSDISSSALMALHFVVLWGAGYVMMAVLVVSSFGNIR